MPSSISSSNQRLPENAGYLRQWITAGVVFALILGGLELRLRGAGRTPNALPSKTIWSSHMDRLLSLPPESAVAVLGASRAEMGFDCEAFEKCCPGKRVELLAINGKEPSETLAFLAERNFGGLVLVSFMCEWVDPWYLEDDHSQKGWPDYYNANFTNLGKYERLANQSLKSGLQNSFASMDIPWYALISAHVPPQARVRVSSRQQKAYYYETMTPQQLEQQEEFLLKTIRRRIEKCSQPQREEWMKKLGRLSDSINKIHAAGGEVVFIHFPCRGEYARLVEQQYPRKLYWDPMIQALGIPAVHYEDSQEMRDLRCPDGSHLNHQEAAKFTELLCEELKKKNVVK